MRTRIPLLLSSLAMLGTSGAAMAESISVWSSTSVEQRNDEPPIVRQEFYTNQPAEQRSVSAFGVEVAPQSQSVDVWGSQPVGDAQPLSIQSAPQTAVPPPEHHHPAATSHSPVSPTVDMQALFDDLFGRFGWTAPHLNVPEPALTRTLLYANGFQQVPSVDTPGFGIAHVEIRGDQLRYSVDVQNLSSPVVMAHFHRGAFGTNGPVVAPVDFSGTHGEGTWTLSEQDLRDVMNGQIYLNIHTERFPDGEIRAQL